MSEFDSVSLEAAIPAQRVSSRIAEARMFVTGLLFTAAVSIVGTVLFTAALLVGVVGSPVIAAVVAYVVIRHRRMARARALAWKPA